MIGVPTAAALGRPNVFEVDLDAIASNLRAIRGVVGPAWLCPALKADAYGFGLVETAQTVLAAGADAVAVGDIAAGLRLRKAGISAPVLVYAGSLPSPPAAAACRDHDLIATVHDERSLEAVLGRGGGGLRVFVEIDAGLQRLGVSPGQAPAFLERLAADGEIEVAGVYAHLHVPDGAEEANNTVRRQFDQFTVAAGTASPGARRMAASSRILARFPEMVLDAVDPGRAVFGLPWPGDAEFQAALKPAFASLRTALLQVKEIGAGPYAAGGSRVGVIPFGRRDGLPALACSHVLVRGRRVPFLGPPALEHSRVDLQGLSDARAGDEVVLVGRQADAEITIAEVVAAHPELAPTAVALAVGAGVERRYRR